MPWSTRQTGVYNAIYSPVGLDLLQRNLGPESRFVFICPTKSAKSQLDLCLKSSFPGEHGILSWDVHRILIADSLRGWMGYMASVEEKLRDQVLSPLAL